MYMVFFFVLGTCAVPKALHVIPPEVPCMLFHTLGEHKEKTPIFVSGASLPCFPVLQVYVATQGSSHSTSGMLSCLVLCCGTLMGLQVQTSTD